MFEKLRNEIEQLESSGYPIEELYRVYGRCQMARELGSISSEQFMLLNDAVVAGGFDNN